MFDFDAARRLMVDGQIRTSDITDSRIAAAMLGVARERFVPEDKAELAYVDTDLPLEETASGRPARRLVKAVITAKLIQIAEIAPSDHVLVVGCATGYGATLVGRLAASVVALEEDRGLAAHAREALATTHAANVTVVEGPLAAGWPNAAPYNVVLIEGVTEIEPQSLAQQLKEGGRLVCVLGGQPGKGMIYRWINGDLSGRPVFDGTAPVLPGFARTPEFVF